VRGWRESLEKQSALQHPCGGDDRPARQRLDGDCHLHSVYGSRLRLRKAGGQAMSRRARERQEASDAKHYPERWQDERDEDDEELPEREDDPPPANTFHISRH